MSTSLGYMLSVAVRIEIHRLKRVGGPSQADYDAIGGIVRDLAERGDVLLFGGPAGEPARLFAELAKAIAIAAFQPGGITAFGETWEATL